MSAKITRIFIIMAILHHILILTVKGTTHRAEGESIQKVLCTTALPWSQVGIVMTLFESYCTLLKIFQYCFLFIIILPLPKPLAQAFFDILYPTFCINPWRSPLCIMNLQLDGVSSMSRAKHDVR